MRRSLKIVAAAVLAVPVLLVAGLYAADFVLGDPTDYNRERWIAYGKVEEDNTKRSAMVRAVEERLQVGMSETDVVDLLGKPDTTRSGRYSYAMGISPYGIDYEYFVVSFGPDNRVARWGIERG